MKNNLYLIINGEIVDKYEDVVNVVYDKNDLSFYIGDVDYALKELNVDVILAPQELKITKDNYKNYILKSENTLEENEKIEDLESKIEDLTKLIEAMSLNTK